ncbi:hypothetical protein SKAU_G00217000 [Synaphobranchus kaupii]|uniref:Uncharacterized protein n=1 Tax=Synaphobranchus kaupii TaxID=118154 RepID=A0A9Q1FAH5_SYNKA|nr:hypothetical protein SKAU_G00217000 [Synaphobranchus kaupii]
MEGAAGVAVIKAARAWGLKSDTSLRVKGNLMRAWCGSTGELAAEREHAHVDVKLPSDSGWTLKHATSQICERCTRASLAFRSNTCH